MKILVIAEHDNHDLKTATLHTITAALELDAVPRDSAGSSNGFDVLIMGFECPTIANALAHIPSIKNIFVADNEVYQYQLAENCAALAAKLAQNYDYILCGATTFGKNLLPRLAALLDVSMVSDVIQIVAKDTFVRPIYAGNVLATVQSEDKIKLLTIRTTAFPAINIEGSRNPGTKIERIDDVIPNSLSSFESQSLTQSMRPELTNARIVISGGRGLKSAENFRLLESIADHLGAAIGASRAAVDAGFAPNDYQVGQTGKIVAPDLYIAVGISGAIQHLAGMKDSKVVVAINNDPEAPIMQVADYALVGDLFKILPELEQALEEA